MIEDEKPPEPTEQPAEEDQTEEKKPRFQLINKYDEVFIADKQIQLLPYDCLSELVSNIVFDLLLTEQKEYSRKIVEEKFEKLVTSIKDGQSKLSKIDLEKILEAIHMVDTSSATSENQSNAKWKWIGPDCINLTGATHQLITKTKNIEDVSIDHYRAFKQAFPFEINQRESSFFQQLLHNLEKDAKSQFDPSWFTPQPQYFAEHTKFDAFEKVGFAALKNKNVNFIVEKPVVIIGCKKKAKTDDFDWQVDLDLFPDPFVSKQHALLMFNFQTEKFEIKCISQTNPIKVKDKLLYFKDDPKSLEENCFIRIGKQTLWFTILTEGEIDNDEFEEN